MGASDAIEKSTSTTRASWPVAALFSLASAITRAPGASTTAPAFGGTLGVHREKSLCAPLLALDPVIDSATGRRARLLARSSELDDSWASVGGLVRKVDK